MSKDFFLQNNQKNFGFTVRTQSGKFLLLNPTFRPKVQSKKMALWKPDFKVWWSSLFILIHCPIQSYKINTIGRSVDGSDYPADRQDIQERINQGLLPKCQEAYKIEILCPNLSSLADASSETSEGLTDVFRRKATSEKFY